jgi:hypothetical protein
MPLLVHSSRPSVTLEGRDVYGIEIWQVTIPSGGTNSDTISVVGYPRQAYFYCQSSTSGQISFRIRHAAVGMWASKTVGTVSAYALYGPYPVIGASDIRLTSASSEAADRVFYVVLTYW